MARASPTVVRLLQSLDTLMIDDARPAGAIALKFELCNPPTLGVANLFTGSA